MLNIISKSFFIMASMVIFLPACTTAPINQKPPIESKEHPPQSQMPDTTQTTPESVPSASSQALSPTSRGATSIDIPVTKPAPTPSNPAVLALLSDAEKYQQQGNMPAAQSRLQRAQRITPRDPKVYYQLAQTHYELEDYRLAEQVALKGVSYTKENYAAQKRFWLLVVDIREKLGDATGAKAAREQAARF